MKKIIFLAVFVMMFAINVEVVSADGNFLALNNAWPSVEPNGGTNTFTGIETIKFWRYFDNDYVSMSQMSMWNNNPVLCFTYQYGVDDNTLVPSVIDGAVGTGSITLHDNDWFYITLVINWDTKDATVTVDGYPGSIIYTDFGTPFGLYNFGGNGAVDDYWSSLYGSEDFEGFTTGNPYTYGGIIEDGTGASGIPAAPGGGGGNTAPTFSAAWDYAAIVYYGDFQTFSTTASDVDGGILDMHVCTTNAATSGGCTVGGYCADNSQSSDPVCLYQITESPGTYNWYVFIYDDQGLGASNNPISGTFTVANNAPTFNTAWDDDGGATIKGGSTLLISTDASDPDTDTLKFRVCSTNAVTGSACSGTEYCNNIGSLSNPSCSFATQTDDTSHTWYAFLFDVNDEPAINNPKTGTFTTDSTPPNGFSITSVEGDVTGPYLDTNPDSDTNIVFSVTGATACKWATTDLAYSAMSNSCGSTSSCTFTGADAEQSYTYHISCVDTVGNENTAGDNLDVTWTNSFTPTATMESPTNTTYYLYPLWFNVTAIDASGIDSCQYSLDGLANVTMQNDTATHFYNMITSLSSGEHNITYTCNNTAGYTNSTPYEYFTFDPTAQFPSDVNVSINNTRVYNGINTLYDLVELSAVDEINTFIDNCVADGDGYCYVPIETDYAETGKLTLSDVSVLYNFPDSKAQAVISNEGLNDVTLNTIRATANDGTFCEFMPSYTNLTVGDFLTVSNSACVINCNNFLSFRVTTTCGTSDEFIGTPNGC